MRIDQSDHVALVCLTSVYPKILGIQPHSLQFCSGYIILDRMHVIYGYMILPISKTRNIRYGFFRSTST